MENTSTFEEISNAVMQLPRDEKVVLSEMLLADLGHFASKEIESAWAEEADRRYQAYLRGEMDSFTSEEVFDRVRERIQSTRR